jgi:hypothetical protein
MVNQSVLAEELDAIIEMVPAFSPEFLRLIEFRSKLAPQPKPEWSTALELDRDIAELQLQSQKAM